MPLSQWITLAAAISLSLILVYSGLRKAANVHKFGSILETTYGLNRTVAAIAGPAIPLFEVAIAASLVWPSTRAEGLVATIMLFSVIVFVAVIARLNGRSGDCGCFGREREQLSSRTFVRLMGLIVVAAIGLGSEMPRLESPSSLPLLLDIGFLVAATAVSCLIVRSLIVVSEP